MEPNIFFNVTIVTIKVNAPIGLEIAFANTMIMVSELSVRPSHIENPTFCQHLMVPIKHSLLSHMQF
jgi:hypothetical protein